MASVFLTGGSGFLGRSILDALQRRGETVWTLMRKTSSYPLPHGVHPIIGSLEQPSMLRDSLPPETTVIHAAALTGKAPTQAFDINVEGTRSLLRECIAAGVGRIIFISSIAATYPSYPAYPYADSKRRGEVLVRNSGIPFDIIQPTILTGPKSPAMTSFARLAGGPIGLTFGSGKASIQPIDVTDAARAIVGLLDRPPGGEATVLGGPEAIGIGGFLGRLRHAMGHARGPTLPLPLGLSRGLLGLFEPALGRWLPLTAAQLTVFGFGATVPAGQTLPWEPASFRNIDTMISEWVRAQEGT